MKKINENIKVKQGPEMKNSKPATIFYIMVLALLHKTGKASKHNIV